MGLGGGGRMVFLEKMLNTKSAFLHPEELMCTSLILKAGLKIWRLISHPASWRFLVQAPWPNIRRG